jgi:hypothetical protein
VLPPLLFPGDQASVSAAPGWRNRRNLVTDCYLLKRLQTSSAAGYTRKYPCNRLLLGFDDGAREGGEVVVTE